MNTTDKNQHEIYMVEFKINDGKKEKMVINVKKSDCSRITAPTYQPFKTKVMLAKFGKQTEFKFTVINYNLFSKTRNY